MDLRESVDDETVNNSYVFCLDKDDRVICIIFVKKAYKMEQENYYYSNKYRVVAGRPVGEFEHLNHGDTFSFANYLAFPLKHLHSVITVLFSQTWW